MCRFKSRKLEWYSSSFNLQFDTSLIKSFRIMLVLQAVDYGGFTLIYMGFKF